MGFDQTFRRDGEARGRALGQYMRHVAERVFTHVKTAIGGNVDLPFGDILPVMTAGRHSQNLDETGCRRFVTIGGGVGNSQAHDEEFRVVAQCRAAAEVRSLSLWERVGVRGLRSILRPYPLTRIARAIRPLPTGEVRPR